MNEKDFDKRLLQIGHSIACYLKGLGQPQYEVTENLYLFGFKEAEVRYILKTY